MKLANNLVGDVITDLGIQEGYFFYMTQYCSGNYVPNYSDPNAKMNFTSCTPYSKFDYLSLRSPIQTDNFEGNISTESSEPSNSTTVVGTTKLDFSAIDIPNKFSGGGGALHAVLGAIEAFQIIGIVTAGILIILCPLHIVISTFSFWVRLVIAAVTAISFITIAIDALLLTGVSVVASVLINKLVGDLGLTCDQGVGFLAIVLISTMFMGLSTMVWLVQAFNNRYEVKEGVQKDEISRPILPKARAMTAYPERPAKSYNEASRYAEEPGYQTGTISRVI